MPLQGSLKEMSLANLIQVNCQEMRSARLTIDHDGSKGEVYFSDGQVVHALARNRTGGTLEGEKAIYHLLGWDQGTFSLDKDLPTPAKSITLPWPELLLEAMKRLPDEQAEEFEPAAMPNPDILSKLGAIEGVTGAVIAASDGIVLAAAVPEGDGEREAAVTVFVGSAARQIGQALKLGEFTQAIATMKTRRVVVLAQPDRFVGLWLGENASPAIVANTAVHMLPVP